MRFEKLAISMVFGLACSISGAVWASPERLGPTTMCSGSISADVPLVGLWRVDEYREVFGSKGFFEAGDLLLISAANDGSLCMELTREVVGSSYYRLQASDAGAVVDNELIGVDGSKLKLLLRATDDRALSIVVTQASADEFADVGTGTASGAGS